MSNWLMMGWRFTDGMAQRSAAWLALFIALGVFSAAVTLMTWVARSISTLAAFGWGLPVLVAIGTVLAVVLILSLAVSAWRYYYPLDPAPTQRARTDTKSGGIEQFGALEKYVDATATHIARQMEQLGDRLAAELTELKENVDERFRLVGADVDNKIAGNIRGNTKLVVDRLRELASGIDAIKTDIVRLNEFGVSQHQINDALRAKLDHQAGAEAVILVDLRQLERNFDLLIKAIRARQAATNVLLPNDKTVMHLGKGLAEATAAAYPNPESWLSDYQRWHAATRAIDRLVAGWAEANSFVGYVRCST